MILREDDERACPPVIRDVLVKKDGWSLYDESEPAEAQPAYNLFWKTNRFYPSQINACRYPYQRCNHYPKSSEITKKDGLYRHMKRMKVVHGAGLFNFVPETFTLPNEYVKFCQYFADEREKVYEQQQQQQQKNAATGVAAPTASPSSPGPRDPLYICKPAELSRGRKIFVFDDIGELTYDCSSVVQRYVDRPLLIFGHKVDFRIYVLVTSFQPLRMYIYENFLTRFGGEKYDIDTKNTFVHLTNYSVTKTSTSDALRNAGVGETCKWDGDRTRAYFESCGVDFDLLWTRIETLVRCTVLSIFHLVPQRLQCFELYGFDILFDDKLQPWLIEANFSPALAVESDVDVRVKHGLIHDLVETLNIHPHPTMQDDDRVAGDSSCAPSERAVVAPSKAAGSASTRVVPSTSDVTPSTSSASARSPAPKMASNAGALASRVAPPAARSTGSGGPARSHSTSGGVAPVMSNTGTGTIRRGTPVMPAGNVASAVRGATRRSSSTSVGVSRTSSEAGTLAATAAFVDRAAGRMKMIFPFNAETERLSAQALQPGLLEASLKGMLAEVRKADAKASQQLKSLAAVYAEKSVKREATTKL